jgi:hypothetical protein
MIYYILKYMADNCVQGCINKVKWYINAPTQSYMCHTHAHLHLLSKGDIIQNNRDRETCDEYGCINKASFGYKTLGAVVCAEHKDSYTDIIRLVDRCCVRNCLNEGKSKLVNSVLVCDSHKKYSILFNNQLSNGKCFICCCKPTILCNGITLCMKHAFNTICRDCEKDAICSSVFGDLMCVDHAYKHGQLLYGYKDSCLNNCTICVSVPSDIILKNTCINCSRVSLNHKIIKSYLIGKLVLPIIGTMKDINAIYFTHLDKYRHISIPLRENFLRIFYYYRDRVYFGDKIYNVCVKCENLPAMYYLRGHIPDLCTTCAQNSDNRLLLDIYCTGYDGDVCDKLRDPSKLLCNDHYLRVVDSDKNVNLNF